MSSWWVSGPRQGHHQSQLIPQPLDLIFCGFLCYIIYPTLSQKFLKPTQEPGAQPASSSWTRVPPSPRAAPPSGQHLIIPRWAFCHQAVHGTFHPQMSISVAARQVAASPHPPQKAEPSPAVLSSACPGSAEQLEDALGGGRVPS